ncbi:RNA polymerase sigma factor [Prolixibacteraceae bacterium JC049]|nr:RNA polymerase sigma factor [Prolixibacteraceae bacterium JC049]
MTITEYNNLVELYADRVYRFVLKCIRSEELAKDIVQESFARMWKNRPEIDGNKGKSYLFTTAHHMVIDTVRKEQRQTVVEQVPERGHESNYSDLREILDEALEKLPSMQKSVIVLRDYEGYSYKEIASICDISEAQVKINIYRGRVALKKYIGSMETVI